jgi:hypothetical protein
MGKLLSFLILLPIVIAFVGTFSSSSITQAETETVTPFHTGIDLIADQLGAHDVQTADLNRDGHLDVVSVGRSSNRVLWHENNGGALPQFTVREVGQVNGAYAVFPADLDRDGDSDIVVVGVGELQPADSEASSGATGSVVWFENHLRAGGGFARHVVAEALNYPVDVQVADLDRDGDGDLVVALRDSNQVLWFENNGARPPGFTMRVVTANAAGAVSVHVADVDGDGDLDILSASENDNKIAWYANDGNRPPNFTEHVVLLAPPPSPLLDFAKDLYAADLDGDGDVDIAYIGEENNEVGWFENLGGATPTFQHHLLATDVQHGKAVLAVDVDGDGDLDLLTASGYDHTLRWFENDGATPVTFHERIVTTNALGARAIHAADIDGDGDLDLLSAARDDHRITWYPNRTIHRSALYTPQTQSVIAFAEGMRAVFAADLDKDGDLDLLSVSETEVSWYENNGQSPPGFTQSLIGNNLSGGRWVYAADLDGDGDLDVVAAAKRNNLIAWYENLGGKPPTFATHVVTKDARGARAVLAADIDGDGDLDLYSASDSNNSVYWYENQGGRPLTFVPRMVTNNAKYVRSAYAADLDNDGDIDLMSASQADNKVAWYENQGNRPPTFVERAIDTNAPGAQHIHADDLDGDGDIDILAAAELSNSIYWYENQGGSPPTFVRHTVTANAPAVHAIYTGDADRDGDIDIFAAIEASNTIAWFENLGGRPPTFVEHTIVTNAQIAHGVYAADVDGDGDLDVLSASREDGKVAWYENVGGQYAITAQEAPFPGVALGLTISHRGRPGDPDLAVRTVEVQFVDGEDKPLSAAQVLGAVTRLSLYRSDCCGGGFDPNASPQLATVAPLEITAEGRQVITLSTSDTNARVPAGGSASYALVVDLAQNGCQNNRTIRMVNIVSGRVAQSQEQGLPLLAEYMRTLDRTSVPSTPDKPTVVINEFLASNEGIFQDPGDPGDFPDWFELYNTTATPINLEGKYLTDDLTMPDKFAIPAGLIIPAYGHLLFIADGQPEQGANHTNFKLDKDGEVIGLYERTNTGLKEVDVYVFGVQTANVSEGRYPDGSDTWTQLGVATPGGRNMIVQMYDQIFFPTVRAALPCE